MPNQFPVPPTTAKLKTATTQGPSLDNATAFRDCHDRYQECLEYRGLQTTSGLHETVQNYILDFELAAKRSIGNQADRFTLFRLFFLENRNADECCARLGVDRFTFASESRHVESIVGESLIRRGLFPLERYFNADSRPRSGNPVSFDRLAA